MKNTAGHRIQAILHCALAPAWIDVIDESHMHASHAHVIKRQGASRTSDDTHYHVRIVSETFKGKTRIERHRIINQLLHAEFVAGLHALSIEAKAPGE